MMCVCCDGRCAAALLRECGVRLPSCACGRRGALPDLELELGGAARVHWGGGQAQTWVA